jgi:hypothetical protein
MFHRSKYKKFIPLFIIGGIGLIFLAGWIVQLLWNATITEIFGVKEVTYWQAFMLIILCKILFGSHYNVHKSQKAQMIKHHILKKEPKTDEE